MQTNEQYNMSELIIANASTIAGIGSELDVRASVNWGLFTDPVDIRILNDFKNAPTVDQSTASYWSTFDAIDVTLNLPLKVFNSRADSLTSNFTGLIPMVDVSITLKNLDKFNKLDVTNTSTYSKLATLDGYTNTRYTSVRLFDDKEPGVMGVTPLSPVDTSSKFSWGRINTVDTTQILRWGYSLNQFIVGGGVDTNYPVDPEAVTPPVEPPINPEVIRIVNVINIVKLPERTPIRFTNLTLALDLDSIAWVANFNVSSQADLALIRPTTTGATEVEISINSEVFVIFVGRTSTNTSVDDNGAVVRRIRCTGWSRTKALTYPYSARKSRTEASGGTPAGILNTELTGTGFTGAWSSPSWLIPANVFGYVDKAPLAAISDLVNSVGAVIIPHPSDNSFEVKPYYPTSPWNWTVETADKAMHENQFFSIDTDWIPSESPDSIYVYGEEHGVAVQVVRTGTPGSVVLPTVVDKHITDTIAGTERGRIEIARNGFKELVPVTTYLEPTGIIMPQTLLAITQGEGILATTWLGMVVSTSIGIVRNGNAVTQSLQIERHY